MDGPIVLCREMGVAVSRSTICTRTVPTPFQSRPPCPLLLLCERSARAEYESLLFDVRMPH